jgi:hypothetical protein
MLLFPGSTAKESEEWFAMARGMMFADHVFSWTVEAHVGAGCPNKPDDVGLVQLGYSCVAKAPSLMARFTPQEQAIIKSIVPGEHYSGSATDKLTLAIRAQQRVRGGTQDGRVSPVQNAAGMYSSSHGWMITALVNNIYQVHVNQWPHLHRIPGCPAALAKVSKYTFEHV